MKGSMAIGVVFLTLSGCAGASGAAAGETCVPFEVEVAGEKRVLPGVCEPRGQTPDDTEEPGSLGTENPMTVAVATPAGASESRGLPNDGRLVGGKRLEASEHITFVASETRGRHGGNFYGTDRMVALLPRVIQTVRRRVRGAKLHVGELSSPEGGPLPGHGSHQNGRDVDLAFFYRDDHRERIYADSFVPVGENGASLRTEGVRYHFDDTANWILIETLLLDPEVHVQYVFVAEFLELRLLEEAGRQAVPAELKRLAAIVMRQPEEHPHDNHYHVRIRCAEADGRRCRDDGEGIPRYGHRERASGTLAQAAERRDRLRLGMEDAGRRAMRENPSAAWRRAIPGRDPSTLAWPVREGRFGRGFGMTRTDLPDVMHRGVDIGAVPNSLIRASATGLVLYSGDFRSFGNCVFLLHKNGWVTTYAHNSRNTVVAGEIVRAGEPIGLIGSTGISRGPHLHFEFRDRGALRDPEEVLNRVRTWRRRGQGPTLLRIAPGEGDEGASREPAPSSSRPEPDPGPRPAPTYDGPQAVP